MGLVPEPAPGATPLDLSEAEGLIPEYIETQSQLNDWEAENILKGNNWALSRKRSDLLTDAFLRKLHVKMFEDTWEWAGKYRTTVKSLGIGPEGIAVRVREIMEDVRYMVEYQTDPLDEIAILLHHKLVEAHPFPNGNGRVTRLLADLFLWNNDLPVFSWGAGANLVADSRFRERYISALQAADQGDIRPLLEFAKS